jgi:hypothetical protein
VKVDYRTEERTAEEPEDYNPANGTLTFAPGEVQRPALSRCDGL